jgi:hypothetical protein
LAQADDGAREERQGEVEVGAALVADRQASEPAEPRRRAFDMR